MGRCYRCLCRRGGRCVGRWRYMAEVGGARREFGLITGRSARRRSLGCAAGFLAFAGSAVGTGAALAAVAVAGASAIAVARLFVVALVRWAGLRFVLQLCISGGDRVTGLVQAGATVIAAATATSAAATGLAGFAGGVVAAFCAVGLRAALGALGAFCTFCALSALAPFGAIAAPATATATAAATFLARFGAGAVLRGVSVCAGGDGFAIRVQAFAPAAALGAATTASATTAASITAAFTTFAACLAAARAALTITSCARALAFFGFGCGAGRCRFSRRARSPAQAPRAYRPVWSARSTAKTIRRNHYGRRAVRR